jgi:hypothetical protein
MTWYFLGLVILIIGYANSSVPSIRKLFGLASLLIQIKENSARQSHLRTPQAELENKNSKTDLPTAFTKAPSKKQGLILNINCY